MNNQYHLSSRHDDKVQTDGDILVATEATTDFVPMYALVMHNDDYTPMDFVVEVLVQVLHLPVQEAYYLMLTIHFEGRAKIGAYPKEIAETKVAIITQKANAQEYPLLTTIEVV